MELEEEQLKKSTAHMLSMGLPLKSEVFKMTAPFITAGLNYTLIISQVGSQRSKPTKSRPIYYLFIFYLRPTSYQWVHL